MGMALLFMGRKQLKWEDILKNTVFNVTFTAVFLGFFLLILYTFSDVLVGTFSSPYALYPKDKSLGINSCQQWTENVRDFNVKNGEEANRLTVLAYNRIIDEEQLNEAHFTNDDTLKLNIVLTSEFEKQMAYLAKHQYTSLTAEEFYLFMQNKITVPKNSVFITFDDGLKTNLETAYPILKKYEFTAINFIDTGHITEKDNKIIQDTSVHDLQKGCDVFDFQSHTYNFHQRNEEDEAYLVSETKKAIQADIAISLVNLDKKNNLFSYPYGEYDDETIEVLKQLNIKMAFTIESNDVRPGMDFYKIPRKAILSDDTIEDFKKKINMW